MSSSAPTVMVSSTFYDLRQIREELRRFIGDDLGYTPLLSELPSFPVDPDLDTIQNCEKRVSGNADVLVLIIGGRYGFVDEKTDKSVTNLEYSAARKKGIPIYAFIDKNVLSLMPVWKKNPNANFSTTVDSVRIFEFIDEVRSEQRHWTFPFENAQDIITLLRIQIAHLFNDALTVRH